MSCLELDLQGVVPGLLLQSWVWVIYDASGTDYPKRKKKGIQGFDCVLLVPGYLIAGPT